MTTVNTGLPVVSTWKWFGVFIWGSCMGTASIWSKNFHWPFASDHSLFHTLFAFIIFSNRVSDQSLNKRKLQFVATQSIFLKFQRLPRWLRNRHVGNHKTRSNICMLSFFIGKGSTRHSNANKLSAITLIQYISNNHNILAASSLYFASSRCMDRLRIERAANPRSSDQWLSSSQIMWPSLTLRGQVKKRPVRIEMQN